MKGKTFNILIPAVIMTLLIGCHSNTKQKEDLKLRHLGDIPFNEELDDSSFVICNGEDHVYQYFNLGNNIEITGDKPKIISFFKQNYNDASVPKESGLIRVRFIVNCNGETDRFRVLESDLSYNEKKFDKTIVNQILKLTKSLTGWKAKYDNNGQSSDYYQYLLFKIIDGKIIKILP